MSGRGMDAKEVKIPLALIAIGLALLVGRGFYQAGASGAAVELVAVAVAVALIVTLGVIACFITAKIMDASFGYLNTAILKLAGITLATAATSMFIPGVGWFLKLLVNFGLLMWLFDLEVLEVVVLALVLWGMQTFGMILAMSVFPGLR